MPVRPETTCWDLYETKPVSPDHYISRLMAHFNHVNGDDRYTLIKGRNHINLKDGVKLVFQCSSSVSAQRNLYLEMYQFGYRADEFLARREDLHIDYMGAKTPPDKAR